MKKLYFGAVLMSLIMANAYAMEADRKSGAFVGADISVAPFKYVDNITGEGIAPGNTQYALGTKNNVSFNYGLKIGYQFYGTKNHGVRITGHFNMGQYSLNASEDSTIDGVSFDKTSSYFGLRYGIDLDYLFDFYNSENYALGFSAGLGYEFANYVKGKTDIKFSGKKTDNLATFENSPSGNGALINLGFHYYFENHQFEIGVRLPFSIFSENTYTARGNTHSTPNKPASSTTPTEVVYQNVKIIANPSYHLSYTYRF